MSSRSFLLTLVLIPVAVAAQVTTPPDSAQAHHDTLTHTPARLQSITVTAGQTPREVPMSVIRITPSVIAATNATSPWDLLRLALPALKSTNRGRAPASPQTPSIRFLLGSLDRHCPPGLMACRSTSR